MGRKLTTGRYETRNDLVDTVWRLYKNTDANQSAIAKITKVSESTVATILAQLKGETL